MPAAYVTEVEAQDILEQYALDEATPTDTELTLASDRLDLMAGWIGSPYSDDQLRAFPRTTTVRDDTEGEVPQAIKDWVTITAYQLTLEDEPDVISERIDTITTVYAQGLKARPKRLKKYLLRPYRAGATFP